MIFFFFPCEETRGEANISPKPHDLEAIEVSLEPTSAGPNCHGACAGSRQAQPAPHQGEGFSFLYPFHFQSCTNTHQNNGMNSQEGTHICVHCK